MIFFFLFGGINDYFIIHFNMRNSCRAIFLFVVGKMLLSKMNGRISFLISYFFFQVKRDLSRPHCIYLMFLSQMLKVFIDLHFFFLLV